MANFAELIFAFASVMTNFAEFIFAIANFEYLKEMKNYAKNHV